MLTNIPKGEPAMEKLLILQYLLSVFFVLLTVVSLSFLKGKLLRLSARLSERYMRRHDL